MNKLTPISNQAIDRLTGYLAAAESAFMKGQCYVTLEASFFDIADSALTNIDALNAAYGPDADFNGINVERECSLQELIDGVNDVLTLPRSMWASDCQGIPRIIEENLRNGYWERLKACFDYENARVVELGNNIPWVNIVGGFTYILYSNDMKRCAVLVGNTTD